MRVLFLNVWGYSMRDSLVPYLQQQVPDTDVFCFQEATDEMRQKCAAVLTDYQEISHYKSLSENDDFAQSVYVRKNIDIISKDILFADDMRVGLAIAFKVRQGTEEVYICDAHGSARPNEKLDNPDRLRFSAGIIDFFKNKDEPVIIGGDFNLDLPTDSIGMFEGHGYRNLITEYDIKTTRNHFAWDRYPDTVMYYCDYTFVNDRVQVKGFVVPENEVSDHLPMILETLS